LVLLAGCSFEAPLGTAQDLGSTIDAPVALDAAETPDAAPPTPDAFVKVCAAAYVAVPATGTQSKYRRVQVQTAWATAKADCASDGGHIAIPETATEAVALVTFVNPLVSSPYIWAGILDPELDGTWVTVTGAAFGPITWGAGDPDQRTGEIYALVHTSGDFYDWFDYGTQEYACECTP